MDSRSNMLEALFSRNPTPPTNSEQHLFSPPVGSSPGIMDTLYSSTEHIDSPSIASNLSLQPETPGSSAALLSLLSPSSTTRSQPLPQPPPQPQQVPTPPGSSSRSNPSPQQSVDSQKLLEQIIGGSVLFFHFSFSLISDFL